MGIFRKSKGVIGTVVDVRVDRWMSLSYLSETTGRFKDLLTSIVSPEKAKYKESFDEAMQRLELTEDDISQRRNEFKRLVLVFILMTCGVLIYCVYLAAIGSIFPAVISLALSIFTLTQAFKYHFWLFQIKHRKLGCTLKEWFNDKIIEDTDANSNQ